LYHAIVKESESAFVIIRVAFEAKGLSLYN